jgi:hypothetical protein
MDAADRCLLEQVEGYARMSPLTWVSKATLAKDLNKSESAIGRGLKRLEKNEWLKQVYSDDTKSKKEGIVLLKRLSEGCPVAGIPASEITSEWCRSVREGVSVNAQAGRRQRQPEVGVNAQAGRRQRQPEVGVNAQVGVASTPMGGWRQRPQNKDTLNIDTDKKDEEKTNHGISASSFVNGFSHEEPGNGEALDHRLTEEDFESWLHGQAEFDSSHSKSECDGLQDVASGPRIDDRALEPLDRPKLPAEALAAIKEHTPDLLEEAQLEARRILEAVRNHYSVIGSAAWEIRQARFTGREVREPIELLIAKCRALADAADAEGSPPPPFPDLATFQVSHGPNDADTSDLRRGWDFIWNAWHKQKLCEEFVRHHRRYPIQWWKEALADAAAGASTVSSMWYVIKIMKTFHDLGTFNERAEKSQGAGLDGLQDGWKATLKERGIEHAPSYPWKMDVEPCVTFEDREQARPAESVQQRYPDDWRDEGVQQYDEGFIDEGELPF